MPFKPYDDRILVMPHDPLDDEEQPIRVFPKYNEGRDYSRGTVVAVSTTYMSEIGETIDLPFTIGDEVVYDGEDCFVVVEGGVTYHLLLAGDVLGFYVPGPKKKE